MKKIDVLVEKRVKDILRVRRILLILDYVENSRTSVVEELKRMGLNMIPSQKGPDSVKFGISSMQSSKMMVTGSSLNTIKEFRNYSFIKTRDGEYIDKPVENWNHSIDAIRYGITHLKQKPNFGHYSIS